LEHIQAAKPKNSIEIDLSDWMISPDHFLKSFIKQEFSQKLDSVVSIKLDTFTFNGLGAFMAVDKAD